MTDAATEPDKITGPTPDNALRAADKADSGPVLAADGRPLKQSLNRALRAQKIRALALIAPLLLFVLVSFIAPIGDMLFRSVENQIVEDTMPRTVQVISRWDPATDETPDEMVYQAAYFDLFFSAEARRHTRLGQRLNYESTGMSSMFRSIGRDLDEFGEPYQDAIEASDPRWEEAGFWYDLMSGEGANDLLESRRDSYMRLMGQSQRTVFGDVTCGIGSVFGNPCDIALEDVPLEFSLSHDITEFLPLTAEAYSDFAVFTVLDEGDVVAEEEPWEAVYTALGIDLKAKSQAEIQAYNGTGADALQAAYTALAEVEEISFRDQFIDADPDWGIQQPWQVLQTYSAAYTPGYFLNAVDMQKSPEGWELRPENQRIYGLLFQRTLFMSLVITFSCILLGYPIAYLLSNLPARKANLLMILVLLPFWTSLLVRTSAWKVMLQQQGVINDVLVWLGLVADDGRLVMINNQFGTIVAMTHILLPFMILPMYSVMSTIPQSYVRAAKSLGATNWTTFWRVYFPQSVPGIGAGSILVFILSIGYYITPEIVGGTSGIFISNRIAYHISSSLNWGLAAALGTILLIVVLALYWAYDRIVGIDNVKLGG